MPFFLGGNLAVADIQRATFVWLRTLDYHARPLILLGQISRIDANAGTFRLRLLDDLSESYREFPIDPHGPENTPDAGIRRAMLVASAEEAARYLDHQEFLRVATASWQPAADDTFRRRRQALNLL